MLDAFVQDLRITTRALARSRVFTTITVASICVGLGATTAIVSVADTLLLRPPPGVQQPERIVTIGRTQDGKGFDNFSYPTFADYQANSKSLSSVAALRIDPQSLSLGRESGSEVVQGGFVSGTFFDVLGARPFAGRFFNAADDVPGGGVVVISHRFWQNRLGADPSIVGHKIILNGSPFVVIGIAAEGFQGPFVMAPDLWVPLRATVALGTPNDIFTSRESVWLMAIGRLAPSATIDAAQSELSLVAARAVRDFPEANKGKGVRVMPVSLFPGDMQDVVRPFMAMLLAVAGLVLVIASINVTGMLLARAAMRQREIAVRLALGASRARLVRQLLTESLVIFISAAAAAVVLAHWMVNGLMSLVPRLPVQLVFEPHMDWRVLGFAVTVSMLAGILVGLVPALQSTSPDLVPALKLEGSSFGRGGRQRLRGALLVSQLAFSMLLLVVAGLFARTIVHARSIDPGFDPRGVEITSLDLGLVHFDEPRGRQLTDGLLERVRSMPGVTSASVSAVLPLSGSGMGLGGVEVAGRPAPDERRGWNEDWDVVSPDYFATMGIRLVRGRDFSAADRGDAASVAILNESFANRLWPGDDAVGRTFKSDGRTVTVIGLARDSKYRSLGEPPRSFVYVPMAQRYMRRFSLLVRTQRGVSVASDVKRALADLAPTLPILDQRPMEDQVATSLFPQRVALWVAGSLGVVALLLALIGVYGVTAFSVARRTREIGVRVALGARRRDVLGMVLGQGARFAGIGVVIGGIAAFGVTRLLSNLLYGVPATDVVAFTAAGGLLAGAAVLASLIPARRAAQIDPVNALRAE